MGLLPAVARCDQFRVVSAKTFPLENAIHPQTLQLILAMAVGWCRYFPAGTHLLGVGIKRDQNFIHLEKYCKMVKLSGGERYSKYFLDNLSKAACVCRKYAAALCSADNQCCGTSGSSADVPSPFQSPHQPTTFFQELTSPAWRYPGT